MTDIPKMKKPKKLPALEATPVKFWYGEQEDEMGVVLEPKTDQNKRETLFELLKQIVGVQDTELASHLIDTAANTIEPVVKKNDKLNIVTQVLHDFGPKNAIEARLVLQADALFAHGMTNLRRAATTDVLGHSEQYVNRAIKLLRLHNETVEALNRFRRGGEQKIVVQHNVMADKAIVNFPGGSSTKNEGDTPCSANYVVQKQEPITIDHAVSQPCPMGNAGFTEVKAQGPKHKKGKSV